MPPAWTTTLLLAGLSLLAGPLTPELAAQAQRVGMVATHGIRGAQCRVQL
jgi:hypothetical protein